MKNISQIIIFDILYLTIPIGNLSLQYLFLLILLSSANYHIPQMHFHVDTVKEWMLSDVLTVNENDENFIVFYNIWSFIIRDKSISVMSVQYQSITIYLIDKTFQVDQNHVWILKICIFIVLHQKKITLWARA